MRSEGSSTRQWVVLALLTLAVILIPFFLFEADITSFVDDLFRREHRSGAIAGAIVLLLGLDVLLPVPSSIVSTAAGATLGFIPGLVISSVGMTTGSMVGYVVGRKCGLPFVRRMVQEDNLQRVSARFCRGAGWALAIMRPVPVLAEASALFAGVTRVPFSTYAVVTTLANTGISAVYSLAGANASGAASFLLAFAASIVLPGIAMVISRRVAFNRRPPH